MADPVPTAPDRPPEPPRAQRADYRLLLEREWADLHHSRIQEWSALGTVTGAHVVIVGLLNAPKPDLPVSTPVAAAVGGLAALFFAVLGGLVTCRHRRLMRTKLTWIFAAERKLGLVRDADNPDGVIPPSAQVDDSSNPRGLAWPRRFSTSWLILMFYILFAACDIVWVGVALGMDS